MLVCFSKETPIDAFLRSDSSLCPTSIVDNDSVPWTYGNVTFGREFSTIFLDETIFSDLGKIQGILCPNVLEALFTGQIELFQSVKNVCHIRFQDWIWWRNHVVAPFSEEFTFRACMVPVLIGQLKDLSGLLDFLCHIKYVFQVIILISGPSS